MISRGWTSVLVLTIAGLICVMGGSTTSHLQGQPHWRLCGATATPSVVSITSAGAGSTTLVVTTSAGAASATLIGGVQGAGAQGAGGPGAGQPQGAGAQGQGGGAQGAGAAMVVSIISAQGAITGPQPQGLGQHPQGAGKGSGQGIALGGAHGGAQGAGSQGRPIAVPK